MDLVEVAPMERPPVCKIMDYGKWRYQQQKKQDKSRAANRGGQLKELIFKTVKIGTHDLMIKVNHAREFLKEGNKVQFTLRFKGREMAHLDLGRELFVKVKQELFYVSKVERDAKMEGRRMTLVLQPDHKDPNTKMPANITATPSRPPPGPPRPPMGGGLNRSAPSTAGSGLNLPPRPAAAAAAPATAGAAPAAAAPRAPAPAPASQSA
jgi:translation initiation factor IF-3